MNKQTTAAMEGRVYVSDVVSDVGATGVALLYLGDDGRAQGVGLYFVEELPLLRFGKWQDNEDRTITVSFTGELVAAAGGPTVEHAEPADIVHFEVDKDGVLSNDDITLYPLEKAVPDQGDNRDDAAEDVAGAADAENEVVAVYVSRVLPSADTLGIVVAAGLSSNGSAALATNYLDDEDPIVEVGKWQELDSGEIEVVLYGTKEANYDEPLVFVFARKGDLLTAVEYDQSLFGTEGLTLFLKKGTATNEKSGAAQVEVETAGQSAEAEAAPAGDPNKGCLLFTNHTSGEVTITITRTDTGQGTTARIASKEASEQCLDPGGYTITMSSPGLVDLNEEFTIEAGEYIDVPVIVEQ